MNQNQGIFTRSVLREMVPLYLPNKAIGQKLESLRPNIARFC